MRRTGGYRRTWLSTREILHPSHHSQKKYAPKSCEGSFAIAELPERVIPKGIPSAELLSQILVDKYIDHLPLYRIRQRFARSGIKIPDSTIDGWVKTCLERL